MRFTVIGHSCLYVETSGPTIIVDPWLIGSCFWRSWWHYPPAPEPKPEWLTPDYVYLTHHHFDHFHFPSMRRIDKHAKVMVPEFGIDQMAGEVRNLHFDKVFELPHREVVTLAPGVRVASYQNGPDDSAFVIADGEHVLVDANDGKVRGRTLKRILTDFGRPTFVFKSYSFAQAYPLGYTADDPADLELVTRDTYFREWAALMTALEPRYGVPFGSMVAFLHPESRHVNSKLVTPAEVIDSFRAAEPDARTEPVQMDPGDTWSSETGFELAGIDWYTDRDKHLDQIVERIAPKIAEQDAYEATRELTFDKFSQYFEQFLHAMPRGVLGRVALTRPVVFDVPSAAPDRYWVIDARRRRVTHAADVPADTATVITVNEGMLADAIDKRLVHVVHGSMRIHAHLRSGGAGDDVTFWGLLVPWELGYLPLHRSISPRLARVAFRRRAEVLEFFDSLRSGGSGSLFERLSRHFAAPPTGHDASI
ncbi:MAG TPA: MBL fold metallo-hydrolase [Acidimicrobiia bacterium]|nr:MBL fold metallo-hydrolase [Acidimicrobiia bacterium]